MIETLGDVSVEEPRAFVGSYGKDTRRNLDDGKTKKRGAFAFTTLLAAHSSEVEDVKSVSFHPIDEPLLESSTTAQTCPFRNVQKGKHRFVDTKSRFSDDTLSVSDYSSIYISFDARDDCDVKVEDETLPRIPSRRRLQLRNRRDSVEATSQPPTVLHFQKSTCDQDIGISLATSTAYDMSACDGAANIGNSILTGDDCEDEGLLLLPGSRITHRSSQLKPKFLRRRGRNPFPGLASMHFQIRRKAAFDTSIVYRKCRGKGLDAGLATDTPYSRTVPSRSIVSRTRGRKTRNGKKTHSQVPSLGYLDIQARYKNAVSRGGERRDDMVYAKETIPADDKASASSVVVDTLRAPLDAPLSTLYEDDDEDSEILSTVSSFLQLSAGRSQINFDNRKLSQPNSLYPGFSNPDETDDEGTLFGEKLLDTSTSENESTASQGRSLRETLSKVGAARKNSYSPLCKRMLLEKSDSSSREESEELDFQLDNQLHSGQVKGESHLVQCQTGKRENVSLPIQQQNRVEPVSPPDVQKESTAMSFLKRDKKKFKKDSFQVNNQNRKNNNVTQEVVPMKDIYSGENGLLSSTYAHGTHSNNPKRTDDNVGASPLNVTQNEPASATDDAADEGIFLRMNSSDISELTDCEFPEGATISAKDQVSATSRPCLELAIHEGKLGQIAERPALIRTSGLRSLLKQPTYGVDHKTLATSGANSGSKSKKSKKYDRLKEREQKNNESSHFTYVQRTKHRKQSSRSEGITLDDCVDDDRQTAIFSDDDDDDSDDPYAGLYCVSQLAV